jgi:hypothetical protein
VSGLYELLAAGKPPNSASAFESYCLAFSREETETTYLAPIEFVHFGKDQIVFGPFTIRWMSKRELVRIFHNSTRALFYQWARIPSDGLSGYWWLIAQEKEPISPIGKIHVDFSTLGQVPSRLLKNSVG